MPSGQPTRSFSWNAIGREPLGAVPWVRLVFLFALVAVRALWLEGLRGYVGLGPVAQVVPIVALGVLVWLTVWSVPRGLYLGWQRRGEAARVHFAHTVVWVGFVLLAAGAETLIERDLHRRMDTVVSAVERFRDERGRYPVHVTDVMPTHLRAIPRPWAFNDGCGFEYRRGGERVSLVRASLDEEGEHPCTERHGVRYRFLLRRWESW